MQRTAPLARLLPSVTTRPIPRCLNAALICRGQSLQQPTQTQTRHAHAISNPTLANIEKRWDAMPPQEQADLWMALRDRMKVDWNEMTLQEKKAAYWIAFGPHGPRAEAPPGEGRKVFVYTLIGVTVGLGIFLLTHTMAGPHPSTVNREWEEKTNEYFKENRIEPITGVSSEGYTGKGQVQSPPGHK